MGIRILSYFAFIVLRSRTFFEPLASRTRSSLGRLKAAVCTPAWASPPP